MPFVGTCDESVSRTRRSAGTPSSVHVSGSWRRRSRVPNNWHKLFGNASAIDRNTTGPFEKHWSWIDCSRPKHDSITSRAVSYVLSSCPLVPLRWRMTGLERSLCAPRMSCSTSFYRGIYFLRYSPARLLPVLLREGFSPGTLLLITATFLWTQAGHMSRV